MSFYDDMQDVTSDVIEEFKQGVIEYVETTPGNGPDDDPGPAVPTYHPVNGTVRGVKFKYVQQGLAVASDLQVTMAVDDGFTPDMKGFVKIDGVRYKIARVIPKPAAGTPAAYVLIVRK